MAKIGKKEAAERIGFLRKELEKHNYNYYVLNAPVISDFEFDLLMQELQGLEKRWPEFASADSPTVHVGSDLETEAPFDAAGASPAGGAGNRGETAAAKFAQVAHRYPMLSLGNTYSEEELLEFDNRIKSIVDQDIEYACELKDRKSTR